MNNIVRLLGLGFILFAFASCNRASEDSSTVSIRLPTYSSSVSSLTCTKCLKAIFVNVDGQDIKKIVYSERHPADFKQVATQINSEITVEVPVGNARRFQVMAVYLESSGKIQVQYGVTTVDLQSSEPPPIQLQLQPLGANSGEFRGGSIAGRYVSGYNAALSEDYGPSGVVNISLVDSASGLEIQFEQGEIINGWFNFFASESFLMKYTVADGTVLFGGPVKLGDLSLSSYAAKLHRPNDYYVQKNGNWAAPEHVTEYHDIVYGFFGSSALLASKKVCFEGTPSIHQFDKLAVDSGGTTKITYSTSMSADVTTASGLNSFNHTSDCPSATVLSSNRYTNEVIYISKYQLDGIGNDNAVSMAGAFTHYGNASGDISRAAVNSSGDITVRPLPTLMSNTNATPFNGVKVYRKANSVNGGFDNIKCNIESLGKSGFDEVTGMTVVPSSSSVIISPTAIVQSLDGLIICPTKNNVLAGVGGMYFGYYGYANITPDSASVNFVGPSPTIETITITNNGNSPTIINGVLTSTNGQFAYPGAVYPGGGTCSTTLAGGGASCTIRVQYNASLGDTGALTINYNVSGDSVTATTVLLGTP